MDALANQIAADRFVIFSTKRPDRLRYFFKSNKIAFEETEGCWKGEREPSFIINQRVWFKYIKDSISLAGEETILHLGRLHKELSGRHATLEWLSGDKRGTFEYLGVMTPTTKEEALRGKAWTRKGHLYYVVKPRELKDVNFVEVREEL